MDNYIPLPEAARKIHLPDAVLSDYAKTGKIKSVMMHNEILLRESDVMAQQPKENFSHLAGHPIGIGEAARKYGINQPTLSRWKDKGYIRVIDQIGQKIMVDEADVAYMAAWYKTNPSRGRRSDLRK